MHFTHEHAVIVSESPSTVCSDWMDVATLPEALTHIRATARSEDDDMARLVIRLDGRHVEFPVQRTMCTQNTICWQSLGDSFLYVLTIMIEKEPKTGEGSHVTINVSYDPPGLLPDVIETLSHNKIFKHEFELDMKRYAERFLPPRCSQAME